MSEADRATHAAAATLVSIVTPLHNGERFIESTIQSVLAQTHPDWEMLIVDDCSTDGSAEIVRRYAAQDSRIQLLTLSTNSGAAVARNTAISTARGRYVAFLDSDDWWLPTKLERQVAFMQQAGVAFTWSSYEIMNGMGEVTGLQRAVTDLSYDGLLRKRGVIGCLTAVYDAQAFGKQYMPRIRMRQDYGLWLHLMRLARAQGLACRGMAEVLARYRVHDSAMTRNKLKAAYYQWRLYRDIEQLALPTAVACFTSYFLRGVLDRLARGGRRPAEPRA